MKTLLDADKPLVAAKDYPRIIENDTAFHDIIYKASRNRRCMNIISNLREQITAIRGRSMPYPGRLDDMIREHQAIYDAIAQRSVDKAPEGGTDPYGKRGTDPPEGDRSPGEGEGSG